MNQVIIQGRLATDIDINVETGTATLLVTVQTDGPTRRVDVIPVRADRQHFTDEELSMFTYLAPGAIVTVKGSVQRRVIDGPHRRTSIQVVADSITEPADLCAGHPSGAYDAMGQTVYCDGRCNPEGATA